MERTLVIPAAGAGSRLGSDMPKVLVPVNGRPMLDHLLTLYADHAEGVVLVVAPAALQSVAGQVRRSRRHVLLVVQERPTGMLDAVLLAQGAVQASQPRRVLVTWCDQVAIAPETVGRVVAAAAAEPEPSLVLPTCRRAQPYVHLDRGDTGRIVRVRHRREGDEMPEIGETDAGVFDLSLQAYLEWLPRYAEAPEVGARTGERNFVPFVAWVDGRGTVVSVPCTEPEEAIGINTPAELAALEAHLRRRHER